MIQDNPIIFFNGNEIDAAWQQPRCICKLMKTKLTGQVIKKLWAKGTNSESQSFFLKTEEKEHHIQRIGGNPFFDEVLEGLLNQTIECEGEYNASGATFLIENWRVS
jgi:hypothetical protein